MLRLVVLPGCRPQQHGANRSSCAELQPAVGFSGCTISLWKAGLHERCLREDRFPGHQRPPVCPNGASAAQLNTRQLSESTAAREATVPARCGANQPAAAVGRRNIPTAVDVGFAVAAPLGLAAARRRPAAAARRPLGRQPSEQPVVLDGFRVLWGEHLCDVLRVDELDRSVRALEGTQPEVIRATWCSGSALYRYPR